MPGQESTSDRRTSQRYDCAGHAEIFVPTCGLRFRGRIANLSTSGCLIEASCRLERGTGVELLFVAEGIPLRVPANLMELRPGGIGFRFGPLSARRLEQIGGLIAELALEAKKENPAPRPGSGIDSASS